MNLPVFDNFCFMHKRNIQPTLYLPCDIYEYEEGEEGEDDYIEKENVIVDDGIRV